MTLVGFAARNLRRSLVRTGLTLLCVTVSMTILAFLLIVLRAFYSGADLAEGKNRLVVRHKAGLVFPLPESYGPKLTRVPGVTMVTPLTWFQGVYIDERHFFPRFASDPENVFTVFDENRIDSAALKRFRENRGSAVAGRALAEKEGWTEGKQITIRGDIYPYDAQLTLVGFFDGPDDWQQTLFFHHKYHEEALSRTGEIGTYWLKVASSDVIPQVARRVDDLFRNSAAETKTETERAFNLFFINMIGNVKLIIGLIGTAVVLVILLIVANTMALAIRERTQEVGILKALGFTPGRIIALVLLEGVALTLPGGGVGLFLAWLAGRGLYEVPEIRGYFPNLALTVEITVYCLATAAAIGVLTGLFPALRAARLKIADAFRHVG